jgi:hypothetical protein
MKAAYSVLMVVLFAGLNASAAAPSECPYRTGGNAQNPPPSATKSKVERLVSTSGARVNTPKPSENPVPVSK